MTVFGNAMIAAVLVGALCGIVGTLVVLRRRAFFTAALTHATFPGGVLAASLGIPLAVGGSVVGLGLVGLMVLLSRIKRQGREVATGIVLSFGYALGTFLHALNPHLQAKIDSFLSGSILAIGADSILLITGMLVIAVLALVIWWKELLFSTFDAEGYVAAGYSPWKTEALSLVLIVGTVVVTMPAIGSILAIAMIAAPAAAANLLVRRVAWIMPLAVVLGIGAAVLGLWASRWFSISAGGSIALAATLMFVAALCVASLRGRRLPKHLVGFTAR